MSSISEEEIQKALTQIKHPVIECDIVKLGIIKRISIEGITASITMAFPFTGAPANDISVRKEIINEVKKSIETLGLQLNLKQIEMTPEEFKAFLAIEKETWKHI